MSRALKSLLAIRVLLIFAIFVVRYGRVISNIKIISLPSRTYLCIIFNGLSCLWIFSMMCMNWSKGILNFVLSSNRYLIGSKWLSRCSENRFLELERDWISVVLS